MTEPSGERIPDRPEPLPRAVAKEAGGPTSGTGRTSEAYLARIDCLRKAVAVASILCGPAYGLCIRLDDYYTVTLRNEPGIWAWGVWIFGAGTVACLVAALALIIEQLARPVAPRPFTFRSVFLRTVFILVITAGIYLWMTIGYGLAQGIGAVIGIFLLLAALRQRQRIRIVFVILAVLVLGPTLWSTQSPYQYARRHADEIVSAGCDLLDRCPKSHYPQTIEPYDARVPTVLRKLGASSIVLDRERVAIYVSDGTPAEFQIYQETPSAIDTVWEWEHGKGGGHIRITDRLWMIVEN